MKKENKIIIFTIVLAIVLITIGISYAYFSVNISGEETEDTITIVGGKMTIVYNGGHDITANNIMPNNEAFATKIFTVTGNNEMDIEMYYQVNLVVEENTFSKDALKYKLISTNTDSSGDVIPSTEEFVDINTGPNSTVLGVGSFEEPTIGNRVHTYKLELYFPETNTNQNIDQGKMFKAHLSIKSTKKPVPLLTDLIITQGGGIDTILNREIPNFNIINGTSGIYSAPDEYGTSYYYRGLKDELNNNLIWAGFQWKIVRINGDGSIRLVYNGTENEFDLSGVVNSIGNNTEIEKSTWNFPVGADAKYVGYMFGGANGEASTTRHGSTSTAATYNETDTVIKTIIDNWYKINIYDKGYDEVVADNLFCNDRQLRSDIGGAATGTGFGVGSSTLYAANHRLNTNKAPTLKCGLKNDRFTVNDTILGNGDLTYPVGLLTADETVYAGLKWATTNTSNYLHTNTSSRLMTPYTVTSTGISHLIYLSISGNLSNNKVDSIFGIRPVLSLSPFAQATGTGTASDPFKV